MNLEQFPVRSEQTGLELPHFPTRLQAIIWRNWGLIPVERLALVLEATEEQISQLAVQMGLAADPRINPHWLIRGYITIIRANWHLLSYPQLLQLLNWKEEELAFALKEDDFLWVKLGRFKPQTEQVCYRPLTMDEQKRTTKLFTQLEPYFPLKATDENRSQQEAFAFVEELSRSSVLSAAHVPAGRVRGLQAGEIQLGANWTICYPLEHTQLAVFVKRFLNSCNDVWGFQPVVFESRLDRMPEIMLDVKGTGVQRIVLRVIPDPAQLAESHTIKVTYQEIAITAVDEVGVLRGLQWMADNMTRNCGPFIPVGTHSRKTRFDLRFLYSYFGVYGDPFTNPELDPYPDGLLERLSELGVNGIWLQTVLYSMVPWDKAPELSLGWERRVEGLRRLVERAADYGIGVYLYLNEPRSMPLSFFEKYPELQGHTKDNSACLCTSVPEVQYFLKNSVAALLREVPQLAGLFTITKSENLTNCYSHVSHTDKTSCPRCAARSAEEVIAEVNQLIVEGAYSVNSKARVLCWNWGWVNWPKEMMHHTISLLPDNVSVISTSERSKPTNVGGVPGAVSDYSISIVGPSEMSQGTWRTARDRGLSAIAKVQINNSWECASVPYLPVLDNIEEHLNNLVAEGVSGLMLGWTLGGFPSPNLAIAATYYWEESTIAEGHGRENMLQSIYGAAAGREVSRACSAFSQAFREFPFHVSMLYRGPQNVGPANLLHLTATGLAATMVCYPYDDLEAWRSIYPVSVFTNQLSKLSRGWRKGLNILERAEALVPVDRQLAYQDIRNSSTGAWIQFHSSWLQTRFLLLRERLLKARSSKVKAELGQRMKAIAREELELAVRLHRLMLEDSRIGFEASNHYFYTTQDLKEKVLNCLHVMEQL